MPDDYFSDEAIKRRVDRRMRRFQWLFAQVAVTFVAIFGMILLAAAEIIAEPIVAVVVVVVAVVAMMIHGLTFGLSVLREKFTAEEMSAAQDSADKEKHRDDMTLGDDGEIVPMDYDPFYEESAHEQHNSR